MGKAICYLILKATKWQLHLFLAGYQIWVANAFMKTDTSDKNVIGCKM